MKNSLWRILSLFLAAVLMFAVIPFSSVAAEGDEPEIKDLVIDENGEKVSKSELEIHTSSDGRFSFIVYSTIVTDKTESVNVTEIVKYLKSEEEVTVPVAIDAYGAYPVCVIGSSAFLDNKQLKALVLPETLETIGEFAFANCLGMETLIMPDNIRLIDKRAFYGCSGLTFVHLPENLVEIGDSAFEGCTNLTGNVLFTSEVDSQPYYQLILPSTVKTIGSGAFSQCESLIRVVIPEGVTDIKTGTFTNCKSLERVEIPASVTYIGVAFNSAFTAHQNKSEYEPVLVIKAVHAEIEISPDIDNHVVVEGVKYSKVDAFVRALNDSYKASSSMTDRYTEFREIEVDGHAYSIDPVRSKEPNCTERGYSAYVCSCGKADRYPDNPLDPNSPLHEGYRTDYKAALGHDLLDWKTVSDAGCENEGLKKAECSRCDHIEQAKILATGHKWLYTDTTTCTKNGVWKKTCETCGREADRKNKMAYGHDYRVYSVTMERVPCQVDGIIDYVCARSGYGCEDPYLREIVPAHADINNDHFCDDCNTYLNVTNDCDCDCHTQIGLRAWFYKIKLFVWKIFGVYKVCECGISHY